MSKVLAIIGGLSAAISVPVITVQQLSSGKVISLFLIAGDQDRTEYKGKFGYDFSYHFASAKNDKNKDWWELIAKVRWDKDKATQGHSFSNEFSSVEGGYEGTNSLKEKCNAAYKKPTKGQIHPPQNQNTNQISHERDIWRYCSRNGELPITLEKSDNQDDKTLINGGSTDSIGKTGKQYLISTRDPRNNWFWEIQEEALPKKIEQKEIPDHVSLFNKFKVTKENGVKSRCEALYKESGTGSDSKDKNNEASVFCSLIASSIQN